MWRFNKDKLHWNSLVINEQNYSTLEISHVQWSNEGFYECSGKLKEKYYTANAQLRVFGKHYYILKKLTYIT